MFHLIPNLKKDLETSLFNHDVIMVVWFHRILSEEIFLTQLKDTHGEKAPSNKTPVHTKCRNMEIWVLGTLNQLFIRGS